MHLRIAHPVGDIVKTKNMYCAGLGFKVLAEFSDHNGFDGLMLGEIGGAYHFEFTQCRHHVVAPTPTAEDLAVFYIADKTTWQSKCQQMLNAGFKKVQSFNPYWDVRGQTFEDNDGYRIVLQNADWKNE